LVSLFKNISTILSEPTTVEGVIYHSHFSNQREFIKDIQQMNPRFYHSLSKWNRSTSTEFTPWAP